MDSRQARRASAMSKQSLRKSSDRAPSAAIPTRSQLFGRDEMMRDSIDEDGTFTNSIVDS